MMKGKQFFLALSLMGCMMGQVKGQSFEEIAPKEKGKSTPAPKFEAPNQIKGRRANYSGVIAQMIKSGNPWQVINPLAPQEFGNGNQNQAMDPYSEEKPNGLKLFSIEF